jgi:hypothetical protein
MKTPSVWIVASVVLLAVVAVAGPACDRSDGQIDIAVTVSPKTLNLASEGVWVTVHADIRYRDVASVSVKLNEIAVAVTKSDDRGDLVAKFDLDVVKTTLSPGTVVLELTGKTVDGDSFSGKDVITVIDVKG